MSSADTDFNTFRQVAPLTLDDQSLRTLIKKHGHNHAAIMGALENIWQETPDQQAVGADWVTTSKPRKTEMSQPKQSGGRREGGAGRSGRMRGATNASSRGGAAKESSRTHKTAPNGKPITAGSGNSVIPESLPAGGATPSPPAVTDLENFQPLINGDREAKPLGCVSSAVTATNGKASWGRGPNLAEKLKKAEADKSKIAETGEKTFSGAQEPAPAAAPGTETAAAGAGADGRKGSSSSRSRRGRSSRGGGGGGGGGDRGRSQADEDAASASAPASGALAEVGNPSSSATEQHPSGTLAAEGTGTAADPSLQNLSLQDSTASADQAAAATASGAAEAGSAPTPTPAQPQHSSSEGSEPMGASAGASTAVFVPPAVNISQDQAVTESDADSKVFLKMGKWEAPVEAAEAAAFQFGSFGNFSETAATGTAATGTAATSAGSTASGSSPAQSTAWSVPADEASAAGAVGTTTEQAAANVWSAGNGHQGGVVDVGVAGSAASATQVGGPAGATTMGALFQQSSGKPIPDMSSLEASNVSLAATGKASPATRAPPGLGQQSSSKSGAQQSGQSTGAASSGTQRNSSAGQVKQKGDHVQQQQSMANQQVQQAQQVPPGIPGSANISNVAPNISPYGYPFDLSQQFMHHPAAGYNPNAAAAAAAAGVTAKAGVTGGSNPTQQIAGASSAGPGSVGGAGAAQAQGQGQIAGNIIAQQQYAPSAPFQYYGNPYYPGQPYFYGQPQVPGYYGQGRGVYQGRGPYGADPYGNNPPLYSGDVYQQGGGQFPENATGGAHGSNAGPAGSNSKASKGGGNPSNSAGGANNSQVGNAAHSAQDLNMLGNNYGYVNAYNPRGLGMEAQQAWHYQQNQAAGGWGAPMMPFPTAPGASSAPLPNHHHQQQQQQHAFGQAGGTGVGGPQQGAGQIQGGGRVDGHRGGGGGNNYGSYGRGGGGNNYHHPGTGGGGVSSQGW